MCYFTGSEIIRPEFYVFYSTRVNMAAAIHAERTTLTNTSVFPTKQRGASKMMKSLYICIIVWEKFAIKIFLSMMS